MDKRYSKLFSTTLLTLITFTLSLILLNEFNIITNVRALSIDYDTYNVDININKDSTINITEKVSHIFNGEAHGARRDIPLTNNYCLSLYSGNNALTCGGFDWLKVIGGYDFNNNPLPSNQFRYYEISESGEDYGRFEWELWSEGEYVTNEEVNWILKYDIYGGLKEFDDGIYFYWDLLPETRSGIIDNSKITIQLPQDIVFNNNDLEIYTSLNYEAYANSTNLITINMEDVSAYGPITMSYRFEKGDIILPGGINYSITNPQVNNNIYLDNIFLSNENTNNLKSIPSGNHEFKVSHFGYKDFVSELNIKSGEIKNIEVSLEPEAWMSILIFINNSLVLIGVGLMIIVLIVIFIVRSNKLRDPILYRTIIPLFTPPNNIRPYMLGSLKDQTVNNVDLVGTIVDLAYRGYLKIKVKNKDSRDFELIKLDKNTTVLDEIELSILDALFDNKTEVKNKDIQKSFPFKYSTITNSIYSKMISDGYYKSSPRTTIAGYISMGILLFILGVIFTIFLSVVISNIIGHYTIFTSTLSLSVGGIGLVILSTLMTSKTNLGKRLINEIKGFKMYLNTAERFRLQKLGPDEFEKYLSYAIVFGIEKEWAKKFEGIYEGTPEWFEGGSDIYNAIIISNILRNFSSTTSTSLQFNQSYSSGSGFGGSGGSFGGFSGGGGGGGSSGGW